MGTKKAIIKEDFKIISPNLILYSVIWLVLFFFFEIVTSDHILAIESIREYVIVSIEEKEPLSTILDEPIHTFFDRYFFDQATFSFLIQFLLLLPIMFGSIFPSQHEKGFLSLIKTTGVSIPFIIIGRILLISSWVILTNLGGWLFFLMIDGMIIFSPNYSYLVQYWANTLVIFIPIFLYFSFIILIVSLIVMFASYFFKRLAVSVLATQIIIIGQEIVLYIIFEIFPLTEIKERGISLFNIHFIFLDISTSTAYSTHVIISLLSYISIFLLFLLGILLVSFLYLLKYKERMNS